MLKPYLAAGLLATALVGSPALAQAPQQPGASPQQEQKAAQPQGVQQKLAPLATPGPDHILSSDLQDATVYGANNESIGDIADIVIDRTGKVVAVVVGVGGFLGVGEKDVAVPFEALELVAGSNAGAGATGAGSTGSGTTAGTTGAGPSANLPGTMTPDRIVLRGMSRGDLEAAPSFKSDGDTPWPAPQNTVPATPSDSQQSR